MDVFHAHTPTLLSVYSHLLARFFFFFIPPVLSCLSTTLVQVHFNVRQCSLPHVMNLSTHWSTVVFLQYTFPPHSPLPLFSKLHHLPPAHAASRLLHLAPLCPPVCVNGIKYLKSDGQSGLERKREAQKVKRSEGS